MGRYPDRLIRYGVVAVLGLTFLGTNASAGAKAQRTAQSYPIVSLQTPLARDAATFEDDRQLLKSCKDSGREASVCLCVTHILKYELTLNEYRAAVRIFDRPDTSETLLANLRADGITSTDIGTARDITRDLTSSRDFQPRCSEAKAYYRPSPR